MKRKNWSLFFIGMLAMCAIAGCSDDELNGNKGINPGHPDDAVYMNVTVQLPVAGGNTRSETKDNEDGEYGSSTDGTEVGKDYENKVNEVLLVLADTENKFIAVTTRKSLNPQEGIVRTTQSINKSTLHEYYQANGGEILNIGKDKIHIYVFCNPTQELTEKFKALQPGNAEWTKWAGTITEQPNGTVTEGGAIWGGKEHKEGFLMTSATYKSIEKSIPKEFKDWENYANESNAFDFSGDNQAGSSPVDNSGNIKVERAVARFDFKDGSNNKEESNTYIFGENNEKQATLKIELTKMALVNMSKNFYYLRRVSDDGLPNGANFKIGGTEYDNGVKANYVVDTDANDKYTEKHDHTYKFSDAFNFCLGHQTENAWSIDPTAREQWFTETISNVLKGEDDNSEGWTPTDKRKEGYKIWRYVTENTIPGINNQNNGITTGIVFKGKIRPVSGKTPTNLEEVLNSPNLEGNESPNDPILYYYANKLYVRWDEVHNAAIVEGKGSDLYNAAFGTPSNEVTKIEGTSDLAENKYSNDTKSPDYLWRAWQTTSTGKAAALKAFKKAATDAGITLYQASKEGNDEEAGYYCYYFYWNRHNDNGNNGVMGPMEFAVVRNNVYKLSVTEIKRLGHPRITENDPDPVDPGKPDEKEDVYLKLSVEVLPWVVRVNDIEF